jgi:phosphotriesterase-related protein
MIATVLGRVADLPEGTIDAHAHVWIDPVDGADPTKTFVLNDERGILSELDTFSLAGGAAVIDSQPPDAGRNLSRLVAISRTSGVAIIASTGFHLRQYYGSNLATWHLSESEAASRFERDLHGESESGVRCGILKAAHPGTVEDVSFRRLLAATCRAANTTGAAIQVHTERGVGVEALVDTLEGEGGDPRRVILTHMDKRPDLALHVELAARGYLLEYDTFLRPKYRPEENVWPLLARALEAGLTESIACGLDLADPTMWRFGGGVHGMPALLTVVEPRLRSLGADDATRRALLRDNICRRVALVAVRGSEGA